ncbi:DUF1642 domain-containing protein [Enterococcus sp.]|uniref:DUF1642 domain-containing protein n=1 Tax=Enterococcus sp. TaxID=35783 RepID=UPI00399633C5
MNKQELIDNIEKLPYLGLNYNSQENVLFQQRKKILEVIKQLDVQAKETVPKFVADWIKQCKENAALADCLNGYYQISNGQVIESEDFQNWVADNENDELTAKAWMFGYEVEKEPLYQIELPGTSWGAYLTKAENGDLVIFQNTTSGSTFTESEIKAIDERYWAFAVPVEEVK